MRQVTVRYHQEGDVWWAETDDLKTFSAAGQSYEEVRDRVRVALPDLLGADVELYDDVTAVGADVGFSLHSVQGGSAPSTLRVQSTLGLLGASATRGSVSVGVGRGLDHMTGPSRNQRVEIS
jgi:predicted RNase H-like HicB family nuclease